MSVQVFDNPSASSAALPKRDGTNPLSVLGADERLHLASVHEFAQSELAPRSREMEEAGAIPPDVLRKLTESGFFGVAIPEEFGGLGMGVFDVALTVESLARADGSVALLVDVHNTLIAAAVSRFGSADQRSRFLPGLAEGRIGAFSLSEAHAGSDAFALRTGARRVSGGYLLNGSKAWVSGGREAGLFLIFARVDDAGITTFLVERENPGVDIGPPEKKVGLKASSTTPVFLKDAFVPDGDVVGEAGSGRRLAMALLNEGRIGIAAQLVGIGQAALDLAAAYAAERETFGKAIRKRQGVAFALADAAAAVETARLATWNAARLADDGHDLRHAAAIAKLTAQRMAERVTSLGIEIHGGVGYTTDCLAEKLWRDAKAGTIYEGTENIQLLTIASGFPAWR